MHNIKIFKTGLTCIVLTCLFQTTSLAQNNEATPIVIGEQVSLHSEVLDEDRPVLIYKPQNYEQSEAAYPVMYLLDGDGHLLHTAGITEFLARNGKMPEVVIVALPNTDRTRDLTPSLTNPDNRFPTAGGADNFLSFIADELMPFIESEYRVEPYKILVGHSFGGLLSVHALLSRPDLFNAHISISPSLWWDNKRLLSEAETFFDQHKDYEGYMYMTMGNEGGSMLSGAWGMAGIFEEKASPAFEWHFDLMKEETHGSIPHRSTYKGLERLYAGWALDNPGQVFDAGGLEAIDAHYASLSEKFGYRIRTPEALINQMGYRLIGLGKANEAIDVLKRNVDDFPKSVNVYDSLGDAYSAAELLDNAKSNYQKACEMGRTSSHPNTALYCANLERVEKQLADL